MDASCSILLHWSSASPPISLFTVHWSISHSTGSSEYPTLFITIRKFQCKFVRPGRKRLPRYPSTAPLRNGSSRHHHIFRFISWHMNHICILPLRVVSVPGRILNERCMHISAQEGWCLYLSYASEKDNLSCRRG